MTENRKGKKLQFEESIRASFGLAWKREGIEVYVIRKLTKNS